jgi:hypothetical protein
MLCSSRLQEPVLASDSPYVPDLPDSFCLSDRAWVSLLSEQQHETLGTTAVPNRKPDLTKCTSLWSRALRCGSIRRKGCECSVRGSVEASRAEVRYRSRS